MEDWSNFCWFFLGAGLGQPQILFFIFKWDFTIDPFLFERNMKNSFAVNLESKSSFVWVANKKLLFFLFLNKIFWITFSLWIYWILSIALLKQEYHFRTNWSCFTFVNLFYLVLWRYFLLFINSSVFEKKPFDNSVSNSLSLFPKEEIRFFKWFSIHGEFHHSLSLAKKFWVKSSSICFFCCVKLTLLWYPPNLLRLKLLVDFLKSSWIFVDFSHWDFLQGRFNLMG